LFISTIRNLSPGNGRNSLNKETWNGVQKGVFHHGHYFKDKVDPYMIPGNPSSGLLPRISSEVPGENGSGDNKIQAYCFRLCLTRNPEGFVQNEGDIGVRPEKPYQIDLGSLMPKKEECSNLLVPVCISCSHIAFGSIRMEPVFMILGQSAGTIAAMALEKRSSIYKLSYEEIKSKLESEGQILDF
jgi:hypothetical protein